MATLTGQSIASSYEQLLHVDTDGGGNTTTLVPVKDGDNGTLFAAQLSTTTIAIDNPTASSATQGGILRLQSDDGAVMASGHRLGVIEFGGAEDTSSTITTGARIEAVTDAIWSASENGADMVFYTTDADAAQTEVMRLTGTDSYVGIGVTAPYNELEVNGSVQISTGSLDFAYATGNALRARISMVRDDADGDLVFSTTTNGAGAIAEAMRIDSEGNVGIDFDLSDAEGYDGDWVHMKLSDTNGIMSRKGDAAGMDITLMQNLYRNSSSVNTYAGTNSDEAAYFELSNGAIDFRTAPAGTRGNTATMTQRFLVGNTGDVTVSTGNLVIGTAGKGIDFSNQVYGYDCWWYFWQFCC